MSVPVHCKKCGYRGTARSIHIKNSTDITFKGGSEDCPQCGGRAEFQSGTYDFIGNTISAFREPGMTRERMEAIKQVAEKVRDGDLSASDARDEIAEQSSRIASVWDWVGENDKQLQVLLIIIGLFLAHYHFVQMSAGPQDDAEVRRSAAQAAERNAQALEKIGEELEKMNIDAPTPAPQAQAPQQPQTLPQAQTNAPRNRAERRRAAAIERRLGSPSSAPPETRGD